MNNRETALEFAVEIARRLPASVDVYMSSDWSQTRINAVDRDTGDAGTVYINTARLTSRASADRKDHPNTRKGLELDDPGAAARWFVDHHFPACALDDPAPRGVALENLLSVAADRHRTAIESRFKSELKTGAILDLLNDALDAVDDAQATA
jgi:hypothetical protein